MYLKSCYQIQCFVVYCNEILVLPYKISSLQIAFFFFLVSARCGNSKYFLSVVNQKASMSILVLIYPVLHLFPEVFIVSRDSAFAYFPCHRKPYVENKNSVYTAFGEEFPA